MKYSLKEIKKQYKRARKANIGMLSGIRDISEPDADKSGFVTLNNLAEILKMEIDTDFRSIQIYFDNSCTANHL